MIASQRMSSMSGIDFLVRAHELHPLARRALLIRVADAGAIPVMEQAFTLNRLDTYLTKPWEPADEWLYPTLADLLREWVRASEAGPRSTVIQLIGDLWEPRCYRLKDLLDRNGLPYAFYTTDSEHGREVLASVGKDGQKLPVDARFLNAKLANGNYNSAAVSQLGVPFQAQFGLRLIF